MIRAADIKRLFVLTSSFLLLAFTLSQRPVYAHDLGSPRGSKLARGNESSGGGYAIPAPASYDVISSSVADTQGLLPYFFAAVETNFGPNSKLVEFYRETYRQDVTVDDPIFQIFDPASDGKFIYAFLEQIEWDLRYEDACYDPAEPNVPKDASAIPPRTICISAPRMAKRTSSHDALVQVFALALHELSHLLKFTEASSHIIQEYGLALGMRDEEALFRMQFEQFKLVSYLAEVEKDLRAIAQSLRKKGPGSPTSTQIQKLQDLTQHYFQFSNLTVLAAPLSPLSLLRPAGWDSMNHLLKRIRVITELKPGEKSALRAELKQFPGDLQGIRSAMVGKYDKEIFQPEDAGN